MDVDNFAFSLTNVELLELFHNGEIIVHGLMPNSSNATLLVTVSADGKSHQAIYKPQSGERPLADFPPGLQRRETAMYHLADNLGVDVIPPTTIAEGPFGQGSLQALINADFQHHYFSLHQAGIGQNDLRWLCALDIVANNTDRKSGHCLLGKNGKVYGIDHGLSFHSDFKLRTVMWDYAGETLPTDITLALQKFLQTEPPLALTELLTPSEVDAMVHRASKLLEVGYFPLDDTEGLRWPWPLI